MARERRGCWEDVSQLLYVMLGGKPAQNLRDRRDVENLGVCSKLENNETWIVQNLQTPVLYAGGMWIVTPSYILCVVTQRIKRCSNGTDYTFCVCSGASGRKQGK